MFLREAPVIAVSKQFLQRLHRVSVLLNRPSVAVTEYTTECVNVRVFLALYMIALRPTHVFESMGPLETSLWDVAKPLLRCFESIIQQLTARDNMLWAVDIELRASFQALLMDYLRKFKAWKIPDAEKLACRIRNALVSLYDAERHLPPGELPDSKLREKFTEQISRLRFKLQQIAGPPALVDFDAQIVNGIFTRGAVPVHVGGFITMRSGMSSEELAHQLLIDPSFQIGDGDRKALSTYRLIAGELQQDYWKSLSDDMQLEPPRYTRVFRILEEIRDGVDQLSGDSSLIDSVLNLPYIEETVSAFTWHDAKKLVEDVFGVIKSMMTPALAAETTLPWQTILEIMSAADCTFEVNSQPTAFRKALEFLFDQARDLRWRAANARFFLKITFLIFFL